MQGSVQRASIPFLTLLVVTFLAVTAADVRASGFGADEPAVTTLGPRADDTPSGTTATTPSPPGKEAPMTEPPAMDPPGKPAELAPAREGTAKKPKAKGDPTGGVTAIDGRSPGCGPGPAPSADGGASPDRCPDRDRKRSDGRASVAASKRDEAKPHEKRKCDGKESPAWRRAFRNISRYLRF
jgi:hypothetical protein